MTHWLSEYGREFWSAAGLLSPWLLLGCLLAGAMHVIVPPDLIRKHLGGNKFLNVFKAVLLGVPLPLCSCSVLPAGVALKRDGASDGAAVGFLISTPQTGVDSITVSAAVLGWPFAILKVVAATVTGLVGGVLANLVTGPVAPLTPEAPGSGKAAGGQRRNRIRAAIEYGLLEILSGIWKWLLVGLAISALVAVLVPEQSLAGHAWTGGFTGLLVMLAVGIPLYVCNTGSLPIAAALVRAGVSPGAALVFLMAGPATNAATIAAVWRVFGRRVAAVYLGTIVVGSLLFGWLFDTVVQPRQGPGAACHGEAPGLVGQIATVVLLGLCLYLAWLERLRPAPAAACACSAPEGTPGPAAIELSVRGLACPNCAAKLQRALASVAGVTAAAVNHSAGTASITGQGLCRETVLKAVRDAGFEVG